MRVAITAAALRTALGNDAATVWRRIQAGESAVAPVKGFDASGFGEDVQAAQIWTEPETPEDDPALRILGPHGRLLDAVALEAHAAAGLESVPRERVGLFVGMGMVDSPIDDLITAALAARNGSDRLSLTSFFAGAFRQIHPLWPLSMLNNVAAGQIAIDLDLRGDNLVLAADGPGGIRALLEAAYAVDEGACRCAIAAGVSGRVAAAVLARRVLDRRDEPPGEGSAALVLEREKDALARGAPVLGIVRGGATSFGEDRFDPARPAVKRTMQRTGCGHAGVFHGTPPPFGDLGPGTAAAHIAVQLAAWEAEPANGARRNALIVAGGVDSGGCIAIEEAAA